MGCNCGSGRGRNVTVTASGGGASYSTSSSSVKWRHWAVDKVTYTPQDGHTDYNTQGEADTAKTLFGGRVQKVDQATGLPLE